MRDLPHLHTHHVHHCRLDELNSFWINNVGSIKDYQRSKSMPRCDAFVTHSWGVPDQWVRIMGPHCNYGDIKVRRERSHTTVCQADWRAA